MKYFIIAILSVFALAGCKNNGQKSSQVKSVEAPAAVPSFELKEIIVGTLKKPLPKPNFQVLNMSVEKDVLNVVVSYSGGCEEHEFNGYFSGGWAKSLPPQASIEFEHLNPNNDACRSMVKDTLRFNAKPLQFPGANEVIVKWSANSKVQTSYTY